MEIIDPEQKRRYESKKQHHSDRQVSGRFVAGVIILIVGAALLFKEMGFHFHGWLFSWQMVLIVIGLILGARSNFASGGWIFPLLIGVIFLADRWFPGLTDLPYFWPVVLMAIGAVLLLSSLGSGSGRLRRTGRTENHSGDVINSSTVFGSIRKNIMSKTFKGGEVNCVFGSVDIDLSQADINGTVVLEVNQVFGGTKLIVPSSWQFRSESSAVLGSVEDHRLYTKENTDPTKTLLLKGSTVFGSIDIKSY